MQIYDERVVRKQLAADNQASNVLEINNLL